MTGTTSSKRTLLRHVLTLFTGSSIAQAIPVMVSPLLTRLYEVSDFAVLTVVATIISLVGVVATGRYELTIGLPENDREARQLVWLSLVVSCVVALFSFIVLLWGRYTIARWYNNPDAANYLLLVPLASLFYGFYQSFSFWNIRKRNYKDLAGSRVSQSVVNSGISLGYAFTGWGMNGLVFGNVVGHLASFSYTWLRLIWKKQMPYAEGELKAKEIRALASRYSDFPRINGVHALTDVAQSTLVIFFVSSLFGAIATGLYGLTMRILQAPLNMIGSTFSIVFYKEVSEKVARKERIGRLLRRTIITLTLISAPIFLCIMIFGPSLFSLVFGEEWREAGVYARIMSPWLFVNFISSPISHLPVILNKQRQFFLLSLIGNSLVIVSLLTGALIFREIKVGLIFISITQVIYMSGMIYYFNRIAEKPYT